MNERPYLVKYDPALAYSLASALEASPSLHPHASAILEMARKTVVLDTTQPDDGRSLGGTRMGGLPDWPAGWDYPMTDRGLHTFFAQLDLAELAPLQDFLPRHGWLYFFAANEEFFDQASVRFYDGPREGLKPYRLGPDALFSDPDHQ